MWTLICSLIAVAIAYLIGGSPVEAFVVAFLAMCYSELCEINRKVAR
ncbi:hypothetical protein [Brevibacillus borstelensis]|nr:hypothetical protein [Brevibacillus borstelensis]